MKRKIMLVAALAFAAVSVGACSATVNVNTNDEKIEAEPEAEAAVENAAETSETEPEEVTDEFLAEVADENAPSIDIAGCDTFTQIVDTKLAKGMGYANEKIGDTDVLLVSSGTYDNLDGNIAAIDATVFIYKDEAPYEAGSVCSAGTAYPLAVKDGMLYTASNHWVCKYTIEGDEVVLVDKGYVEFDSEGKETYHGNYDALFDEMFSGRIVNFSTVGGRTTAEVTALPAYEYTGDDPVYAAVYAYVVSEFAPRYEKADVSIPCPYIVAEDRTDKNDIKIWGNFWINNYNLNGETLECVSGGSYPGLIHLKETEGGYEVTGMDMVGDGAEYDKTAREIFKEHYDDLTKLGAGDNMTVTKQERTQIIADYVKAGNLPVKAYQDYGWDPVPLQ